MTSQEAVTSKMSDQHWRTLLQKSVRRDSDQKMKEEEIRKIFQSIDKDHSGGITKKVKIIGLLKSLGENPQEKDKDRLNLYCLDLQL